MVPVAPPGGYYLPQQPVPPVAGFNPATAPAPRTQPPATVAAQPQPNKPIIRARVDDDPAPRTPIASEKLALAMPSPEELGLKAPKQPANEEVDWPLVHDHLKQHGAVCSQRLQVQDGYRFIVILSTADKDRVRHVEADGPTEAAAVRAALAKVGELRK